MPTVLRIGPYRFYFFSHDGIHWISTKIWAPKACYVVRPLLVNP